MIDEVYKKFQRTERIKFDELIQSPSILTVASARSNVNFSQGVANIRKSNP